MLSCKEKSKPLTEDDKVFHGATPYDGSIDGLNIELYNDNTYTIMHSGGLGANFHKGSYTLSGDTITLHDFKKLGPLERSRLLVFRYEEQDSTYWIWKYSNSIGAATWDIFKAGDYHMGKEDVYQLNEHNIPLRNSYHFAIALDKLRPTQSKN